MWHDPIIVIQLTVFRSSHKTDCANFMDEIGNSDDKVVFFFCSEVTPDFFYVFILITMVKDVFCMKLTK